MVKSLEFFQISDKCLTDKLNLCLLVESCFSQNAQSQDHDNSSYLTPDITILCVILLIT